MSDFGLLSTRQILTNQSEFRGDLPPGIGAWNVIYDKRLRRLVLFYLERRSEGDLIAVF